MSKNKKLNSTIKNKALAVVGLGYVGLPLAIEFGKKRNVIGFDISRKRVDQLKNKNDLNLEVSKKEFEHSSNLIFTNDIKKISKCNIFIVTIPTPIDQNNKPDLSLLKKCCSMIGLLIKKNDLIIFESTVYPGTTEEVCVPILEKKSGLNFNKDFFCGYSPERINPGDKKHRISKVMKITSGSTPKVANKVDKLYKEIIKAGTHKAPSIAVAEAAKVIENTQRDVNIALMNEFEMIFNKLNIETKSVLKAARTKWNFLPFEPGLVGGHCIGVDPYYLAFKSIKVGHNPEMIIAGRRINDMMASYVANQIKKLMISKGIDLTEANILIMGLTFKENCPDVRNTKIVELFNRIRKFSSCIDVFDPWANKNEVKSEYGINLIDKPIKGKYEVVVIAVAHDDFKKMSQKQIRSLVKKNHVIYDLKRIINA